MLLDRIMRKNNTEFRIGSRTLALAAVLMAVVIASTALTTLAQDPPRDGRYYERQALIAYRAKDFAAYMTNLEKALELRPNHPRILYNLSGAYALNNKPVESVSTLEKVAAMGLDYPAEKDTDFDSIKESAAFTRILMQFAENRKPLASGQPAFTVNQKGLIAESIAYDPATKDFFIASVHQRKIIKVNAKGVQTDFATAAEGLWSVFGIKVDAKSRTLWVCTSAMPQMTGFDPTADKNQAALLAFDLAGKKPARRFPLDDRTQPHVFGDLALAPNGDVYVSDSGKPAVYVLPKNGSKLNLLVESKFFSNLQGLAVDPTGRTLFVADYGNGIWTVDLQTLDLGFFSAPPKATLLGIDGLYWSDGALIAIQNGVAPQRVIRLNLNRLRTGADSWQTIEANHPTHDDITLGVVVGKDLYYTANSQWSAIGDDGKFNEKIALKEAVVLRLPLTTPKR